MKKLDSRTLRYIAKAYGGTVKNYAGNDEDPSASEVQNLINPDDDQIASNPTATPPNSASPTPPPGFDSSPDANPNVPISDDALAQADLDKGDDLNAPASGDDSDQESNIPDNSNVPLQDQNAIPSSPPSLSEGYQQQERANLAKAKAEGDQGAAEAAAIKQGQAKIDALPTAADLAQANQSKRDALMQALQTKEIDPMRVYHNMSTGQKILAGIGMILGGAGSGGNQNQVLGMMNNAITNDINAQKNSQDLTTTLWNMNRETYGDDQSANLATKNQILTGVQYQLQAAAANAKGPMAQAAAQNANALINTEWTKNTALLGLNATLHGQTQDSLNENTVNQGIAQASVLAPEMAKDAQKRILPGVGISPSADIPDKAREDFNLNSQFSNLIDRGIAFQKTLPLDRFAWTPAQVSQAQTLRQEFNELSGKAENGLNRLNTEEIKLADKAFPVGKIRYGNTIEGLNKMKDAVNGKRDIMMKSYGIVPFKTKVQSQEQQITPNQAAMQQQKLKAFMQSNPTITDPNQAIQILKQNGKF